MEKTLLPVVVSEKLKAECVWYVYECIFCIAGGDHVECNDRYHV
jgi:hypothetical protein